MTIHDILNEKERHLDFCLDRIPGNVEDIEKFILEILYENS